MSKHDPETGKNSEPRDEKLIRGRGAVRNVRGRFEPHDVVPFDDGWDSLEDQPSRLATVTQDVVSRTIITRNDSPDVPFDQSINPYQGCEHGCVYCFARPTHAFWSLSPGLDFETKILCKPDAPRLLRQALSHSRYRCQPIALGTNTDPYQPVERDRRITRSILEVLVELRHPFSIVTKSSLVLRDLDLLAPMAAQGRAAAYVSITTLDPKLARTMEPRAASPKRRLETLEALSQAGVPGGVLSSPMIPGLNDTELESILQRSAAAGATQAGYILLRLPFELKQIFVEWLQTHFPTRASKVLHLLENMRGGSLYTARFGERMRGRGAYAKLLRRRFDLACKRLGLNEGRIELDTSGFRPPPAHRRQADANGQQRLF